MGVANGNPSSAKFISAKICRRPIRENLALYGITFPVFCTKVGKGGGGGGGAFAGHYGTNTMPHQLHLEGHLMHNEQSHVAVLFYKCRQQYAMYVFRSTHHGQI